MARIPLAGGQYQARSAFAGAQRVLNLYPEAIPPSAGEPQPMVEYPTPGLVLVGTAPNNATIQAMHRASNGELYVVAGGFLYLVSSSFVFSVVTALIATAGMTYSMADNGTDLYVVGGTTLRSYSVNLTTHVATAYAPPTFGTGVTVKCLDTFFLVPQRDTRILWVSGSQSTAFNALDFAAKSSTADPLVTIGVTHRTVWLLGLTGSEIWFNSGGAGAGLGFPFESTPGAFIDYGCMAQYSVAEIANGLYWLGRDLNGAFVVLRGEGYAAQPVSTPAISSLIRTWDAISSVSDAVGFAYEDGGHQFYVLTFPGADKTLVYDRATDLWHERCWLEPGTGTEKRWRPNAIALFNDELIVGDYEGTNGQIYRIDNGVYTDDGNPIKRQRTFPHLENGAMSRVVHQRFSLDMQCGTVASGSPTIDLDWSDDGGQTFGAAVSQSLGTAGATQTSPQWRRLGYARNRVYRVTWTADMETVLAGAVLDTEDSAT